MNQVQLKEEEEEKIIGGILELNHQRSRGASVKVSPNKMNFRMGMALNPNLRQIQEIDQEHEFLRRSQDNLNLLPPGQKASKKEDLDKQSNSSASHSASGSSISNSSNNSRAHLFKVSQICSIKKQPGSFSSNYEVGEQLGQGSFGKVCKCVNKISRFDRAVKFIKKKSIDDPKEIQRFQGEVNILEKMDNQNIVKLYEVYDDAEYFYLIMDLLTGGELFDEIVRRQKFEERAAAIVMFQVF